MNTYKLSGSGDHWKKISILTGHRRRAGVRTITGYSHEPLNEGDKIILSKTEHFLILKEIERRDASGNWPKGDNKNNWYKAEAKYIDIENPATS